MKKTLFNLPVRSLAHVLALLFFACLPSLSHAGAAAEYTIKPIPAWVEPVAVPAAKPVKAGEAEGTVAYLLSDEQVLVEAQGKTRFIHHANKAIDSRGVEDIANINLEFDPAYQSMALHAVRVLRGTQFIDKLPGAKIHVLQREKELEYLVYDGSKTINIVLQDVRVGDVIEYAYSVSGINSVFRNKVAGGAELQWGVPVARSLIRLLVPESRSMNVVLHNTKLKAVTSNHNGMREYRVDQTDVPALNVDEDAPHWYDPYAAMQWSEYADWASVVHWAMPYYQVPAKISTPLQNEIDKIARTHADAEGRLLAALALVQREVRYLGVEVGPGSHAPNSPSLVFERRFGDCKDKAMLTVTMLRALGVDAAPALVNTDLRAGIGDEAPTPNAFNHVIVHAILKDKVAWLDATRSPQRGDLDHLFQPDFGLALVLDERTVALTKMNPPQRSKKSVHTLFDTSKGFDDPVKFTVTTVLEGSNAESMRADIASNGTNDLQKNFLNYYAHDYGNIKVAAPLEVKEDPRGNSLTTVESYTIGDFWSLTGNGKKRQATIITSDIDDLLRKPGSLRRTAPLQLKFPQDFDQVTEVRLPEVWSITPNEKTIVDPAFTFSHSTKATPDNNGIIITDHFSALADHVKPENLERYAAHLGDALEQTGYNFWQTLDENDSVKTPSKATPASTPASLPASATPDKIIKVQSNSEGDHIHNYALAALLVTIWAILLLGLTVSTPAHFRSNRQLLALFIIDSASIASFMWFDVSLGLIVVLTAALAFISIKCTQKIRDTAVPSHALHRLPGFAAPEANHTADSPHKPFKVILGRVAWVALGMVIMKLVAW